MSSLLTLDKFPTCAHTKLMAANIFLDHEFIPYLCDSGLAVLRPCNGNTTELKE
ncbi:hypothetical protein MKX03_019141, partial [Papaver bracteatum]